MRGSFVRNLLTGSALALFPLSAFAQSAAQPADQQKPESASAGDIIVTAMKRVGSVQKTAASIAVVGAQALQESAAANLVSAVEAVPSLQVQKSSSGASFYIRGIGSRGVGGSSPVSVNIDGLYQQQPDIIAGAFADVERIEVLRGPQGTLYGRNANGGTVNIVTRSPVLGERSADVTLGYGNYAAVHAEAAVNLPIGDTLAVRAVGVINRHNGYLSNGLDDANDKVGRIKVLWQPTPDLKIQLGYEHTLIDKKGPGNVLISDTNSNPWHGDQTSTFSDFAADMAPVYCSPDCQPYYRVKNDNFTAQLDYDFGFATLTGLTGIQRYTNRHLQVFSGGIEDAYQPLDQESYEVRLASNAHSPISWVIGGYALNQDYSGETKYVLHIEDASYYPIQTTRSRALFGQATLPVTAALRLTGGLRYTHDSYRKQKYSGTIDATTNEVRPLTAGELYTGSFKKLTYKLGAEYDLGTDAMLYGQFSTGLRSGGIDERAGSFGPETIKALEGGIKSRLLDNTLTANLGAYYYFYGDYQLDYVVSGETTTSDTLTTSNIPGTTRVWGAELETEYRPTSADTLSLAVAWQGSRFAKANIPTSCDSDGDCVYTDLTGHSLPRSPKWTINAGYEHAFELGDGSRIKAHVDGIYKSSYQADIISFTYSRQKAYALANARLVYELPNKTFSVSAYVNNLTNKAVIEQANTAGPNDRYGILNAPRTYGVTLTGHF